MATHDEPRTPDDDTITENWRAYLMSGRVPTGSRLNRMLAGREGHRILQRLPAEPRCKSCRAPFGGAGGWLMKALGRRRSTLNPRFCDICDTYVSTHLGGAEVELTMLFADVRGSTQLAERMDPAAFSSLISRFFTTASDILIDADALIEKLIGDEVAAMFVPGFAGPDHARRAVESAERILRATGHADADGPWVPIGIGVHGGSAFVGAVGSADGLADIVALGDTVNTAARLASAAAAGEVVVSSETLAAAGLEAGTDERRALDLKGRSEPIEVVGRRIVADGSGA